MREATFEPERLAILVKMAFGIVLERKRVY